MASSGVGHCATMAGGRTPGGEREMAEAPATSVEPESGIADQVLLRMLSSLDPEHTLQAVVDSAALLTGAPFVSIWVRTDGHLRAVASHGLSVEELRTVRTPAATSPIVRVIETGEPMEVEGYNRDDMSSEGRAVVERMGVQTMFGLPLRVDGVVGASLWIARTDAVPFSAAAVDTLRRLVSFAEVALANARRFSGVEAERSRLQAYVDAIPEAVVVFDRHGVIQLVNDTLIQVLRVRRPLAGTPRSVLFGPHSPVRARRLRCRYDQNAVFSRVVELGEPEQGLIELDDPARTFEIHFSPFRGLDGEVQAVVTTMRDITDPLELARERARGHLLTQLLDLSTRLNSELSVQALTEHVVEVAMAMLRTRTGTLGLVEDDRMVFRRFHTPRGWIDFGVAVARGEGAPGYVWQTEAPYLSNDCEADRHVLQAVRERMQFHRLVYVPLFDRSGKVIGALGVFDPILNREFGQGDIETLRLLANQVSIAIENARLQEMKDAFLSIVAHELRTPVTSIKGFAQVLQRRLSPESRQHAGRFLDIINHQTDRLATLINDLLDLSRIQTGRFQFDLVPVDYTGLVHEVVAEMRLICPHNPIHLEAPDGMAVLGSGDRLRQVLVNLIDNAVNHGPETGAVTITVRADGREVLTCVRDQGPGLAPNEEERVFGLYYRAPSRGDRVTPGLGLGLFISRRIVEGHQGRIWLAPDRHTTFCFAVPRTV